MGSRIEKGSENESENAIGTVKGTVAAIALEGKTVEGIRSSCPRRTTEWRIEFERAHPGDASVSAAGLERPLASIIVL
jgi:hypothetical protein